MIVVWLSPTAAWISVTGFRNYSTGRTRWHKRLAGFGSAGGWTIMLAPGLEVEDEEEYEDE